jgi:hypothetical protein
MTGALGFAYLCAGCNHAPEQDIIPAGFPAEQALDGVAGIQDFPAGFGCFAAG